MLGQKYPQLSDNFAAASNLALELYDSYRLAQTILNDAITQYNIYIQQ